MNPTVRQDPNGTIHAEAFGHTAQTNPDGSMQITMATGQVFTIAEDGSVRSTGNAYDSIEIADLSKVSKHTVTHTSNGVTHEIELVGGGHCKVEFDTAGTFRSLSGAALDTTITKDNRLILVGSAIKK